MSVHAKKKARTRTRRAAPQARSSAGAREVPRPAEGVKAPLKAQIERHLRAQLAALTGGLAPDDYLNAWWEWYLKLATQPPRQVQLARSAYEKILDSWQFMASAAGGTPLAPGHEELGFSDAAWNVWPFNAYARTYANWASWWQQALAPPAAAADPEQSRLNFAGEAASSSSRPAKFRRDSSGSLAAAGGCRACCHQEAQLAYVRA